ncbi:DUF3566 domain-containing protein [Psychrobium sp. MM17-31]|uniref:DUF3566 domain-containing protein n=1 Tax=Psychrobium sp. MM17-31 TaxID=2917758 RepID=UPI001EF5BE57|nr:DUF3566 domain-containing protein [Psychrobium sp. MM17-31]MCG7529976.1 DUF3566 domain-containing protein [Psychrobium sp. MM17-31]
MKKQIKRLSPHQNGKVIGILMAACSMPLLLLGITMDYSVSHVLPNSKVFSMFLAIPLIYLVVGYLFSVIFCVIYNFAFQYIGGIEFELKDSNTE